MWQKIVGSALLEVLSSGKLKVGRVILAVSNKECSIRIGLAKLPLSLES